MTAARVVVGDRCVTLIPCRDSLPAGLSREFDGIEEHAVVRRHHPDLTIASSRSCRMDGLDMCRRLSPERLALHDSPSSAK